MADGIWSSYSYDRRGNLIRENTAGQSKTYTYDALGRMVKGVNEDGDASEYLYNGLGLRVANIQTIQGENRANYDYRNLGNGPGSFHIGNIDDLALNRRSDTGQEVYTDNYGLTRQNETQEIMRSYIPDYASDPTRELMIYAEGHYQTSLVYGLEGLLKQKTTHLENAEHPLTGVSINTTTTHQNILSDNAVTVGTLYHHTNRLSSADYTADLSGEVRSWADYDTWGVAQAGVKHDLNLAVLTDTAAYTGYTYDQVLDVYFAQYRFYDPNSRRFTSEDPIRSGRNWYAYVGNDPMNFVDPWGLDVGGIDQLVNINNVRNNVGAPFIPVPRVNTITDKVWVQDYVERRGGIYNVISSIPISGQIPYMMPTGISVTFDEVTKQYFLFMDCDFVVQDSRVYLYEKTLLMDFNIPSNALYSANYTILEQYLAGGSISISQLNDAIKMFAEFGRQTGSMSFDMIKVNATLPANTPDELKYSATGYNYNAYDQQILGLVNFVNERFGSNVDAKIIKAMMMTESKIGSDSRNNGLKDVMQSLDLGNPAIKRLAAIGNPGSGQGADYDPNEGINFIPSDGYGLFKQMYPNGIYDNSKATVEMSIIGGIIWYLHYDYNLVQYNGKGDQNYLEKVTGFFDALP
jgi:RHS repeat-associated protein